MKRYIRAAVNDLANESEEFLDELALDPHTDSRILRQLFDCVGPGDEAFYYALKNPNMPTDILEEQSYSGNERTKISVAANLSTPPDVLRRLSADNARRVQQRVQTNPSTPVDVLRDLISVNYFNPEAYVYILQNPATPETMLREIIKKAPNFMGLIAFNPNAPVDILQQIVDADDVWDHPYVMRAEENLRSRGIR